MVENIYRKKDVKNPSDPVKETIEVATRSNRNIKWKLVNAIQYVLPYPRKVLNYAGLRYDMKRGNANTRFFPVKLGMEVTGRCNLRCPLCPRTSDKNRAEGDMKWCDYKEIIDRLSPYLFQVRLHSLGEPMMHPQLFEMIGYAHKKGIYTNFHTNGHFLTENSVLNLFEAGLDEINVAMDGMCQQTYSRYRVGGSFETVRDGLILLCSKKRQLKRKRPRVNLQFLVMAHNEHEIPDIKYFARKIGVDRLYLKSVNIATGEDAGNRTYLPADTHYQRYSADGDKIEAHKLRRCTRTFIETIVNWDGSISVCTGDHGKQKRVSGNVFKEPIVDVLFGEEYKQVRQKSFEMRFENCRLCVDSECNI